MSKPLLRARLGFQTVFISRKHNILCLVEEFGGAACLCMYSLETGAVLHRDDKRPFVTTRNDAAWCLSPDEEWVFVSGDDHARRYNIPFSTGNWFRSSHLRALRRDGDTIRQLTCNGSYLGVLTNWMFLWFSLADGKQCGKVDFDLFSSSYELIGWTSLLPDMVPGVVLFVNNSYCSDDDAYVAAMPGNIDKNATPEQVDMAKARRDAETYDVKEHVQSLGRMLVFLTSRRPHKHSVQLRLNICLRLEWVALCVVVFGPSCTEHA